MRLAGRGGGLLASGLTAGWWVRPRRQDCSKASGKALTNTSAQFSQCHPVLSHCEQLILYPMPAFLLPHNLPWPPSATLSPAVMPRQAFWRSPLCPWHTKL